MCTAVILLEWVNTSIAEGSLCEGIFLRDLNSYIRKVTQDSKKATENFQQLGRRVRICSNPAPLMW